MTPRVDPDEVDAPTVAEALREDGRVQRAPIQDVPITEDPIRLGQFLKLAGLAEDGGHARALLGAEEVQVNGRVETRRGTQLKPGDVVAVGDLRARPVAGR
jgi:ribosome-associated protein